MSLNHEPLLVFGQDQYRMFNRISIETTSNCNRRCSFCPMHMPRKPKTIDAALWAKLVQELGELKFDGVVQLFLLNEPLLDPQLLERLTWLREEVPKQCTYIATNGDALTVEKSLRLFDAGLTVLNINVYDDAAVDHHETILNTLVHDMGVPYTRHRYTRHRPGSRHVALTDMRNPTCSTDKVYSRSLKDRESVQENRKLCARPHRHLVICYNGEAPMCCSLDTTVASKHTPIIGNFKDQTLLELWNSEMMWVYREHTQRGDRSLPGCSTCDQNMQLSWQVRRVQVDSKILRRWDDAKHDGTMGKIAVPCKDVAR